MDQETEIPVDGLEAEQIEDEDLGDGVVAAGYVSYWGTATGGSGPVPATC